MHRLLLAAVGAALLSFPGEVSARGAGAAAELEAARANARAGGPLSARDAELLERHGCLSGTQSAFCRRLESGYVRTQPNRSRKPRPQGE